MSELEDAAVDGVCAELKPSAKKMVKEVLMLNDVPADLSWDGYLIVEQWVDAVVRAAVEQYGRGLMIAGDDVAAALGAAMESDGLDVEAVEHCNAMIERWVERTEHLRDRERQRGAQG